MGRTRSTTRDQLDALEREWRPFRRSLRRRHQPTFDRLFEHARGHAEATTQQNPADHWHGFVVAVLLAQEREIATLREQVADLEGSVGGESDPVGDGGEGANGGGEAASGGGETR